MRAVKGPAASANGFPSEEGPQQGQGQRRWRGRRGSKRACRRRGGGTGCEVWDGR